MILSSRIKYNVEVIKNETLKLTSTHYKTVKMDGTQSEEKTVGPSTQPWYSSIGYSYLVLEFYF